MDHDDAPEDAFSRLDVTSPVLMNISSCQWISIAFEDLGVIWMSQEEMPYFSIAMAKEGRYIGIGRMSIRVEFPKNFFIPDKWFFLCFTYNNENKTLNVYVNSENVFEKIT